MDERIKINSGDVDAIEHRCIHLHGSSIMSDIYFAFRINDKEMFYVCRFCYASIQEQVISELKNVRIKVR